MNQNNPLYLIDHQEMIANWIKKSKKIVLFLDYDGTLVRFKYEPEQVRTPSVVLTLLETLTAHPKYEIIIITGRTLSDIRSKIPINGIHYAAVHGLHIRHANGSEIFLNKANTIRSTLVTIKQRAEMIFSNEPTINIEDKTYTLAFHYRKLSNEKKKNAIEKFMDITSSIIDTDDIELLYGDNVIEVRPKGWNKGSAVSYFLSLYDENLQILPIYIGDDTTDEDAFRYLQHNAITIIVKNDSIPENTSATFWLNNPDEVIQFILSIISS